MRILIVGPVRSASQTGNRVTSQRWARLLRNLGHTVRVEPNYKSQSCDVLLALHARRSALSMMRFRDHWPAKPLILALTGTDVYRDIQHNSRARRCLDLADRLILLQPCAADMLKPKLRSKARVIFQSAIRPTRIPTPVRQHFEVCVMGHLRTIKDPFRTAMAARLLPKNSKIRVSHLGAALNESMKLRAIAEMARNSRYQWIGELPRGRAMQRLARSRLLVHCSKLEGGANVITEAIVASVPVISSRISGSLGLLGEDYPGYFDVGDTQGLAELLSRSESDEKFYAALRDSTLARQYLFDPKNETQSWQSLLDELNC